MTRRPRPAAPLLAPLVGLLAVLLGVTLAPPGTAASGPAATTRTPAPAVPTLTWRACGDDLPGLECATATVPLDHDRPRGATTQVALARIPAADPARRIGTLFLNPGGPGGSGIGLVAGFGPFLQERLQGRYDLVGFDPRGVGASDPLQCFSSTQEQEDFFASTPYFPYLRDQFRPYFQINAGLADRCLDGSDAIARHMSTADVARDLDLLRQAVGDSRLSYLGFSYGSFLGTTYANLFPGKVRAMVIDGVLDPQLWSGGRQIRADRVSFQEVMDELLRQCQQAGPACALTRSGSAARRWERLARAVERTPVTLTQGEVTYDFLLALVGGQLYDPSSWGGPDGLGAFLEALAVVALDGGDPGEASRVLDALLPASEEDPTPAYDNSIDAFYGNHCDDAEYPSGFGAFLAGDAYARAGSRFGPSLWWFNASCARWPVSPDRYTGPWSTRTASPVLVVGNYFDPATDYRGAVTTSRLLRNSRLLSYAGWGHTAYGVSECVTDAVDAYLLTGTLPARGTVCPAGPNPFSDTTTRRGPSLQRPSLPVRPPLVLPEPTR